MKYIQHIFLVLRRNKLFVSILSGAIIVALLCSVFISIVASFHTRSTLRDEVIYWKRSNVLAMQNGVEAMLEQINTSCVSMAVSKAVNDYEDPFQNMEQYALSPAPAETESLYKKGALISLMANFAASNSVVYNVYYYDVFRQVILTSDGRNYPTAQFADMDWTELALGASTYPLRLETRAIAQNVSGYPKKVLSIIMKTFQSGNYIVVNIDANKLVDKVFLNIEVDSQNISNLLCRTDGAITLSNQEDLYFEKFNGIDQVKDLAEKEVWYFENGEEVYFYSYSSALDCYFVSVDQGVILSGGIDSFLKAFLPFLLAAVLLSICLSATITRRIYRPVQHLIREVGHGEERKKDEIGYITEAYSGVRSDYRKLMDKMADIKPMVKSALANTVIFEGQQDREEMKKMIATYDLDIPFYDICVVLFDLSAQGDAKHEGRYYGHFKTIEVLREKVLPNIHGFYTFAGNNLMLIAKEYAYNGQPLVSLLSGVVKLLTQEESFTCTAGVSRTYKDLSMASSAFEEARDVLKYKIMYGDGQVISAAHLEFAQKATFRYPIAQEEQLMEYIILGSREKAEFAVEKIVESITSQKNKLSVIQVHQMLFVLLGNIIKQLGSLGMKAEDILSDDVCVYESILYVNRPEEISAIFKRLIGKIDKQVSRSSEEKGSGYIKRIAAFICENYYLDISLDSVAEHVYLNPAYVSRLIRKETGSTFTEFLCAARLQEAKQLLQETTLKIDAVASRSGFNNSNYFIRIFKTHCGCTPKEYRDSYRKGPAAKLLEQ